MYTVRGWANSSLNIPVCMEYFKLLSCAYNYYKYIPRRYILGIVLAKLHELASILVRLVSAVYLRIALLTAFVHRSTLTYRKKQLMIHLPEGYAVSRVAGELVRKTGGQGQIDGLTLSLSTERTFTSGFPPINMYH